jgi:peptidoglycan/LPS O-acetylase OafA/YrhL
MLERSQSKHLESIESLRGVAALMVMLYHLAELVKIPLPDSLGFISTRFGLGVPLFYTLSGFVLSYGYADKLEGSAQIRRFYIRRLFRIAPLFYAMLALWLLASWVVWNRTFSALDLFFNMSFLFGLVPGQHESIVWAGWSIGIEMLFYLIFPVIVVLTSNLRAALVGFVVASVISNTIFKTLSTAGLGSFAYMNLGTHLPFFMAGIAAYRIWQEMTFARLPQLGWLLLGASALLGLLVANSDYLYAVLTRIGFERGVWAIVFGLLLLSACYASNPVLESAPLRNLGKLSFSLYLLHPMIMVALIKLDFPQRVAQLTDMTMVNFLIASIISVSLVWLLSTMSYRFVESPGIEFGRRLAHRFANTHTTIQQNALS